MQGESLVPCVVFWMLCIFSTVDFPLCLAFVLTNYVNNEDYLHTILEHTKDSKIPPRKF